MNNMNSSNAIDTARTKKTTAAQLVTTALFTALICIMSQLTIPVQPIPFTFSLLAIFLTGALLPPKRALLSVIAYLLLGAFGLPVYSGFHSGFNWLFGMTGGYLIAYPLMAFITALAYKYIKNKILALTCGMVISLVLCYLIGTLWFMQVTDNSLMTALSLCVIPYIPFDILKIVLASSFALMLRKILSKSNLSI